MTEMNKLAADPSLLRTAVYGLDPTGVSPYAAGQANGPDSPWYHAPVAGAAGAVGGATGIPLMYGAGKAFLTAKGGIKARLGAAVKGSISPFQDIVNGRRAIRSLDRMIPDSAIKGKVRAGDAYQLATSLGARPRAALNLVSTGVGAVSDRLGARLPITQPYGAKAPAVARRAVYRSIKNNDEVTATPEALGTIRNFAKDRLTDTYAGLGLSGGVAGIGSYVQYNAGMDNARQTAELDQTKAELARVTGQMKTADEFVHATNANNIHKILQSGSIKPLDKIEGQVDVEPKLLGRGRALMDADEAKKVMAGVKNTDRVFLSRGGVVPSYGDYVIVKNLTHPKEHDRLNLIPNEFTTKRRLSVRHNATVFVPDNEVSHFARKYRDLKIRAKSELHLPNLGIMDGLKTLARKLKFTLGIDQPRRAEKLAATLDQLAKEYAVRVKPYLIRNRRPEGAATVENKHRGGPGLSIQMVGNQLNDLLPAAGLKRVKGRDYAADNRATNLLTALHEGDEFKYMKRPWDAESNSTFVKDTGHQSLGVLLREHNRITTLPAGVRERQAKLFGRLSHRDAVSKVIPGYVHGQSQRLSRHAVKRLEESNTGNYAAAVKTAAAPLNKPAYLWAALKGDRDAMRKMLRITPERIQGLNDRFMTSHRARIDQRMDDVLDTPQPAREAAKTQYNQRLRRDIARNGTSDARIANVVSRANESIDRTVRNTRMGAGAAAIGVPAAALGAHLALRTTSTPEPQPVAPGIAALGAAAEPPAPAPQAPGIAALGNLKKTIGRNAIPVGSTELGLATDSSDVDILVPYKRKHHWERAIERLRTKYPELQIGQYSANKPDKRVLTGPINGQTVDIVLAHGPKPMAFAQRFQQLKQELTPEQRQAIVNRKLELKNSLVLPEYRYKKYKKEVAEQLGLAQHYF